MSFVRIAAAAAIVTLVSAVGATAKPVTLTAETNLRKAPGLDAEVLTLLPKGTTVEVGKCTNGWCETSSDGKDGFAFAQNLGMARRPPPRGPAGGEEIVEEGPPVYGPRYVAGPAGLLPAVLGLRLRTVITDTAGAIAAGDGAGRALRNLPGCTDRRGGVSIDQEEARRHPM
jgi:hypothetical protein